MPGASHASSTWIRVNNDTHRENTLIVILFFTWGAVFLARMSGLYLAPYFAPEFHLTPARVGMLGSVVAITWACSGLFFGALSDRVGRKIILLPCAFSFSILCFLQGTVHNFHQLLFARALMGMAEGPAWPILSAMVKEASAPMRRGRNVGLVVGAAALVGLAAAPVLTTQVAARFGWRWGFFAASIPGIIISILLWMFVQEPARLAPGSISVSFREYFSILRYRNIWLCCAGSAGFICWLFLFHSFAPLYITRVAHQTVTTAGFLIGATGLGSFLLGFFLPALSDKIGRRPGLLIMAGLSIASPLILLASSLYAHLWLLAAILLLTNVGQGVSALVMVLVPSETVRAEFVATAIGLTTFVGEIAGATIAPVLGGTLAEKYGLSITMWIAAGGMFLVLLVTLFMKETDPLLHEGPVRMHAEPLAT
jgi:predicted MFS family arabinose efflux permease